MSAVRLAARASGFGVLAVDPTTGTVVSSGRNDAARDNAALTAWKMTATGLELVDMVEAEHRGGIAGVAVDPTTGTVVSGWQDAALTAWKMTATGLELVCTVEAAQSWRIGALAVDAPS